MIQTNLFYNTINIHGVELNNSIVQVKKQNDRIYQILKQANKKLTPFDVHKIYDQLFKVTPITSIRRAMTQLTSDGKLIKLSEMKDEIFGKPNHYWIVS